MSMALVGFGSIANADLSMQGTGIIMDQATGLPYSGSSSNYNYGNGNYYNNYNHNYSGISEVAVTTVGVTAVNTTSANLTGSWSTSSNGQVGTWFLYGSSMNLGSTTLTRYQNTTSGTFVDTIASLTPNTIYYYRAASIVNGSVSYGAIRTFQTLGLAVPAATVPPAASNSGSANHSTIGSTGTAITGTPTPFFGNAVPPVEVAPQTTTQVPSNTACANDTVTYNLAYKNTTENTITSAMLVMTMPAEVDYAQSSATAQYDATGRTLTIFIGTMEKGQEGVVYVTGKANSLANGRDVIAARVDFNFTNPDNTNSTVTNYITHSGEACQSNLGAFALGTGFLPTSTLGWFLLAAILCLIIYLSRKFFVNKKVEHVHMMHLEHQDH